MAPKIAGKTGTKTGLANKSTAKAGSPVGRCRRARVACAFKIAADKALAKNRKRNSKCKDKVAAKLAAAPVAEEKATDSGEDSSTGEHELSDESANSSR